jgi:hypothetical protein
MSAIASKRKPMRRMKPFMVRDEEEMKTKEVQNAPTSAKKMKKPIKKSEAELKNDFQKILESDSKVWIQNVFLKENAIPSIVYDMELRTLLDLVRDAYFKESMQPKYTIDKVIQNCWKIKTTDTPIRSMHKFFPSTKYSALKKKCFAYATFGGLRLMLHAILGGFLHRLGQIGNLVYTGRDGKTYSLSSEVYVALAKDGIWTKGNIPMAITEENNPIQIDTNVGKHLNVWVKGRGSLALEIDICDVDVVIREHTSMPTERLACTTYLQQTRSTAVRQNITKTMDAMVHYVVKCLRETNKKKKKKQRKKRKKEQNKKKGMVEDIQPVVLTIE